MNQKRVDRLIPLAFKILEGKTAEKIFIHDRGEKKIISTYKSYMSSIGPSIAQAGLIKTLAAFSKKGGSEEDKTIILDIIKVLLKDDGYYNSDENKKTLKDILINRVANKSTSDRLREEDRILEAITAYKLVFDTFKKYEKKRKESEVSNAY